MFWPSNLAQLEKIHKKLHELIQGTQTKNTINTSIIKKIYILLIIKIVLVQV